MGCRQSNCRGAHDRRLEELKDDIGKGIHFIEKALVYLAKHVQVDEEGFINFTEDQNLGPFKIKLFRFKASEDGNSKALNISGSVFSFTLPDNTVVTFKVVEGKLVDRHGQDSSIGLIDSKAKIHAQVEVDSNWTIHAGAHEIGLRAAKMEFDYPHPDGDDDDDDSWTATLETDVT